MLTHKELVEIGYTWLMKEAKCSFALKELRCYTPERPDVLGFCATTGDSILIECKVSREDFKADLKKWFRSSCHLGMGDYRFYLSSEEIITTRDLESLYPPWGLLWASEDGKVVMKEGEMKGIGIFKHDAVNRKAERAMLISALRRIQKKQDIQNFLK